MVRYSRLRLPGKGSLRLATLGAIVGLSVLFTAGASAQPATTQRPNGPRPTVVLVHGAWADSSSWNGVIKRLQNHGYTVIAPANPLRGLASDSAYVASVLATVPGPIVLVGHSYGGAVISNAAAGNANVKALVYIAAFIPDVGETGNSLVTHFPGSHIVPPGFPGANLTPRLYPPLDGTHVDLYINADSFRDIFAADLPVSKTAEMAVTQRPLDASAFGVPSAAAAWKTIPSWILVATQDNAIGTANTRFMAKRVVDNGTGHSTEIRASHAVLVSHPDAVEDLIRTADLTTR